ncbi:MAG: hypothetical protein AB7I79_00260 [Rhizobiaceae bacterium]
MKKRLAALALFATLAFALPSAAQAPADRSDETLMTWYGATLRQAYRSGETAALDADAFLAAEEELDRRGLITTENLSEIERGIVYVGMPLAQALASIDGLEEVDTLVLKGHLIRSFRGPTSVKLGSRERFDTFIACDDRIVTLYAASGLITAETYNQTFGSGRIRFQTNFAKDFWTSADFEPRIRGNREFRKPGHYGDRREHRWSLFSNNSGVFVKPSDWHATGATSYRPKGRGVDINDMMNGHIRKGGSVC